MPNLFDDFDLDIQTTIGVVNGSTMSLDSSRALGTCDPSACNGTCWSCNATCVTPSLCGSCGGCE